MFEDFFNHECNIYHTEEHTVNAGYGIKSQKVKMEGETVSIRGVRCHFHFKNSSSVRITQSEPFRIVSGDMKLSLPFGTDIRLNDIVEDCESGLKYKAGVPREVHGGHHIIVLLQREGGIEAAV